MRTRYAITGTTSPLPMYTTRREAVTAARNATINDGQTHQVIEVK